VAWLVADYGLLSYQPIQNYKRVVTLQIQITRQLTIPRVICWLLFILMKILNLYAGIGGNRLLWGNEHEITAVEYNPEIAKEYQRLFPNDTVIVTDAHQYLIDHVLDGWDFIWASPPCPSHSRINTDGNHAPRYPEMTLYQEIIMLSNNWYKGKWVVENVIPYYEPLIKPNIEIDRHYFWCNFWVNKIEVKAEKSIKDQTGTNGRFGFNLKGIDIKANKRQVLRNLVDPEIGLHLFNRAFEIIDSNKVTQKSLFDAVS
jgi:DNA (cytosine-5)-methyltransferase 1